MKKEFDLWNSQKKILTNANKMAYAHPREVWWCAIGVNVGAEVDGKNENFERPVLVVRVYNKETMLVLPITGKEKADNFHYQIQIQKSPRPCRVPQSLRSSRESTDSEIADSSVDSKTGEGYTKPVWIKLTQARVISNSRLLRKVDVVPKEEFDKVVEAFRKYT